MKNELSIKVIIAGRTYPLTIDRDEEESIRQAVKVINESIKVLESNYAVKDKQDLLAMVALQMASELEVKKEEVSNGSNVEELDAINQMMASYMAN